MKSKLTIRITPTELKEIFARDHNIEPEDVEIVIENYENPRPETERAEQTTGEIVGKLGGDKPPFLKSFMKERGIRRKEAAEKCNVSEETIRRAGAGHRLRRESFERIVDGLGLTKEERREFKKSLSKKQRQYYRKRG